MDPRAFCRVNKQYVVAREHITSIVVWSNSRLLVSMDTETPEPVFLSKTGLRSSKMDHGISPVPEKHLQACEVSAAHQILFAAGEVGLAVGQHVEAVGDIRHMAVHMVGHENAFRGFSCRISALSVDTCSGATCEKVRRA